MIVLQVRSNPPAVDEPDAVTVSLTRQSPPGPKSPTPAPTKAARAKPAVQRAATPQASRPAAPPTIARANARPVPEDRSAEGDSGAGLSDAAIAGAASAGSGGGGGGSCDMVARVQNALRKDPLVRSAVADLGGKAVLVWNGDWVRTGGEDGKGLAAVREAIMWEVAFAPAACRAEPVRGLVLFTLPGPQRLVVGGGEWRWTDMLGARAR